MMASSSSDHRRMTSARRSFDDSGGATTRSGSRRFWPIGDPHAGRRIPRGIPAGRHRDRRAAGRGPHVGRRRHVVEIRTDVSTLNPLFIQPGEYVEVPDTPLAVRRGIISMSIGSLDKNQPEMEVPGFPEQGIQGESNSIGSRSRSRCSRQAILTQSIGARRLSVRCR